jgi:hypothetical protein
LVNGHWVTPSLTGMILERDRYILVIKGTHRSCPEQDLRRIEAVLSMIDGTGGRCRRGRPASKSGVAVPGVLDL